MNGLPEPLKTSIEAMSGLAMDEVRIHRNSAKPAAFGALAFTQGSDIHLGVGQETLLPHEAWHVVQQKQGRVTPTGRRRGKEVNDDRGLEREADRMGGRAAALGDRPDHPLPAMLRALSDQSPSAAALQFGNQAGGMADDAAGDVQAAAPQAQEKSRYVGTAPTHGATLRVVVTNDGEGGIEIVDATQDKPWQRSLEGHIACSKKEAPNEVGTLLLESFEAKPTGLGLGAMLLRELAAEATRQNCELIQVLNPAITAMGAYIALGAGPMNPRVFERLRREMLESFQAHPETHQGLVQTEAKERASEAVQRATFFNPAMGQNEKDALYQQTRDAYAQAHAGAGDYDRLAAAKAMSPQLFFIPSVLLSGMTNRLSPNWTIQ